MATGRHQRSCARAHEKVPSQPSGGLEIRDFNGAGEWSQEALQRRYREYGHRFGLCPGELRVRQHDDHGVRWIYPIMEAIIEGIARNDPACIELGVEFIESGHKQPFGRILHSKTARALRRAKLGAQQVHRLRCRILSMLVEGQVPHEYREYSKLLRAIGIGDHWDSTRAAVDEGNPYVMRFVRYFEHHCDPEAQSEQQTGDNPRQKRR